MFRAPLTIAWPGRNNGSGSPEVTPAGVCKDYTVNNFTQLSELPGYYNTVDGLLVKIGT